MSDRVLTDRDYERLLEFRTGIRRFLKWSATEAGKVGLAPMQHQLLLAVRGHADHPRGPTIGDVAEYLLIRPNSAAELVKRAEEARLLTRVRDSEDGRVVRLRLSRSGKTKVQAITDATFKELRRMAPHLGILWQGLESEGSE